MGQFTTGIEIYGADVVGTSTGLTAVFTAPQPFAVYGIQIITTGVSGLILGPTLSIGTNSTSYNNINSGITLTSLSIVNNALSINIANPGYIVQTNDIVYANVTIAALATTYNFQVLIVGYPI